MALQPSLGSGVWRIPRHSIMKWSKVIVLMPPTSCKYQILPPAKLFVKGRYTAVSVCSENDNGVRNENMGFCGRWRRQSTSVILVKCMTTRSSCLYKFQNFILTSTASEKSWISMGTWVHHCTTQCPSKAIISLIYLGYVLAQCYLRIMVVSSTPA